MAMWSLPLASAMQMSLAFPLSDEHASLSSLYCASAFVFAIAWPSFDIGATAFVGELFIGAFTCAAADPARPSPAAANSAIISLDMFFLRVRLRWRAPLGTDGNFSRHGDPRIDDAR